MYDPTGGKDMLNLKLNHSNVSKVITQVHEDPEYYMGKFYKEFAHMISSEDAIYAEVSILTRGTKDVIFIPLNNGYYFCNQSIKGLELVEGNQYTDKEVLSVLELIRFEYDHRGLPYYYDV